MKFCVKVWSGAGIPSVERYWTCESLEESLRDIKGLLIDEKAELNERYGSEDGWDYSDCKGYTIEAIEDDVNPFVEPSGDEVVEFGVVSLDEGVIDDMILKCSETPKINYFALMYDTAGNPKSSDFSRKNLKELFDFIYENDIEGQLDITCRLDVDSSENMLNLTTIYTDSKEFTEIGVDPRNKNVKYLKYEYLDEVQEAIEKWLTPDNLKLAERY